MTEARTTSTDTTVRDADTGRNVTVRGVGALQGRLKLKPGVDLTKPIASQAMRSARRPKSVAIAETA